MYHPVLHLEAVRTLTHPRNANIFELIKKSEHVTFQELRVDTKLSKSGLSAHLNQLFDNYLIKVIMSKEGDNYTKYVLTKKGEYFHKLLHKVFEELNKIPHKYETNQFVIDGKSFWKLYEKFGVEKIASLFRDSKIVLTNTDFSFILERNEENDDKVLEELLYSEELVEVPRTYEDTEESVMNEFYLRRTIKIEETDAQVVALAADLNGSLISDNPKILQAAKKLGILSVDLNSVFDMDITKPLAEQFYELANKKYDPKDIEFLITENSPEILKKN